MEEGWRGVEAGKKWRQRGEALVAATRKRDGGGSVEVKRA